MKVTHTELQQHGELMFHIRPVRTRQGLQFSPGSDTVVHKAMPEGIGEVLNPVMNAVRDNLSKYSNRDYEIRELVPGVYLAFLVNPVGDRVHFKVYMMDGGAK